MCDSLMQKLMLTIYITQRGLVVRTPKLKPGGPEFKSCSDHYLGCFTVDQRVQLLGDTCNIILYCNALYGMIWYGTVQYGLVWYCIVLYYIIIIVNFYIIASTKETLLNLAGQAERIKKSVGTKSAPY